VQLDELEELKNLMTSSGNEPAAFWLVAKCLNQQCYCVPPYNYDFVK
jgi:hypothetical protein